MSNSPDTSSPQSVMTKGGFYNRHSQTQAKALTVAFPYWEEAAAKVNLPKDGQVFRVADLGSSQGKNSLEPMRRALQILRSRRPDPFPISIVHTDQPGNDFAVLFTMLHENPDSYLRLFSEIYPSAIGRSFYGPLFPQDSLDLAWSSIALHWMSRIPALIKNHILPHLADRAVFQLFERQAKEDWENFLTYRARELKKGAHLVLVAGASDENLKGGGEVFYERMNQILKNLVMTGGLERSEYEALVLPIYTRTVKEFQDPLQKGPLKEFYKIEGARFDQVLDAQCLVYQKDGDIEKFATDLTGFLRGFTEPLVRAALSPDRNATQAHAIVEKVYSNFCMSVREDPHSLQFHWNLVALHLLRI